MIPDPSGALDAEGRAELLRLLHPVAQELERAVLHPPHVAAGDWLGPASEACRASESEVRGRLVHALEEVDRVLARLRSAA
jgi:hypothetical protein